jgi:hypothetical protein
MPDVQEEVLHEQETPKRKLTWEEVRKAIKRNYDRTRWNSWMVGKRIRVRQKKSREKQAIKKRLKKQKEHPEEILAKRKYWIIKR